MKILKFFCLALLYMNVVANEEQFLKAHEYYHQHEYEKALHEYQTLSNKSAAVWYNMGNCAFKMNNHQAALAFWNCAEAKSNILSELRSIAQNKKTVLNKMDHTIVNDYQTPLISKFPFHFLKVVPISFLQLLFLSVWFIVWFLILKRKKRYVVLLLLMNGMVCCGLIMKYKHISQPLGLVSVSQASIYAGPNKDFHQIGTLNMYTIVTLNEQKNEWCKIQNEKNMGWVLANSIMRV